MAKNFYHREPGSTFRDRAEAFHVLSLHIRDDMEWFNEVQPETLDLAMQVVKYLHRATPRLAVRRSQQLAFGRRGRAMRFESEAA